ncbi:MAG TPA: hypothetical protein PK054_11765 [Anaerohalosphaeraceae bacterium]|nr:hypothetical protein [Anaerohalosphaeraceae bacterium]HPP57241.1 hypothetical protein [Anaerohalosphaeraceae bacterium]
MNYSTLYYFKARVHNSAGWAEGSVLSFRTDVSPNTPAVIVDNGAAGTSFTGTWSTSSAADPYGSSSLWARDGATYTWSFTPPSPGFYDVSMWWTQMSSRSASVPVQIEYSDGIFETTVNQQTNGGQWNSLGQFYFDSAGSVTITALGTYPVSTCADAVRFALIKTNQRPTAQILSIEPQILEKGRYITFSGKGLDDGSVGAYEWTSSLDGVFGTGPTVLISTLSQGTHLITLRVCDDMGIWSLPAEKTITITAPASEVIVDNGAAGTSFTGTWSISSAPAPYGSSSLWARNGATYTWSFTPPSPGFYDVSMWWTQMSSRSASVPVQIEYSDGIFETTVNQQTNGGQWNSLGQFYFDSAGSVTITALGSYPVSTCADAVRFTLIETNLRPTAQILSILPQTPQEGQSVTLSGQGIDDGQITAFEWTSDIDGQLGTTSVLTVSTLSEGTHTLSFRVCDNRGIWSEPVEQTVTVLHAAEEIIIDNGEPGTSSTGTWAVSGGLNPYGADSLWARYNAAYTWSFQPQQGGLYDVFLWWTEFSSRGYSIPVLVTHQGGTTTLYINQQTGGGEWNWIGTFPMEAGETYTVQIRTPNDNSTACADAVRIIRQ